VSRLNLPMPLPKGRAQANTGSAPTAPSRRRGGTSADLAEDVESIVIPVAEQVNVAIRPEQLGTASVERELDARGDEQDAAWRAAREVADRPARIREAEHEARADAAGFMVQGDRTLVARAGEDYVHATTTLSPWLRRKPWDPVRYVLVTGVLAMADAGAVASAMISMGDVVWTATVLGVGVGVAAVTGGLVGGEVQDIRQARIRTRDSDSLSADERRYQQVFSPPEPWMPVTKIAVAVMFTIAAILGVGIFALRSDLEGTLAGTCFALLAVASALGSAVNAYMHADLVADLLGNYKKAYTWALKRHTKLSEASALATHPAAGVEAASIGREHDALGQAAVAKVDSMKWGVLRRNPHVFGHGETVPNLGAVGRRPRTDIHLVGAESDRDAA